MRTLLLAAVEGEAAALLAGLGVDVRLEIGRHVVRRRGPYDLAVTGVGIAAAAVVTTELLGRLQPDAVVSVGVAGGFGPAVGSLVVGTVSVAVELGRESGDGVAPFALAPHEIPLRVGLPGATDAGVVTGPIATVQTVTTSEARARRLADLAVAEAMEGFGVASAALALGVPCGEWRAISNPVAGPWDLPSGLAALQRLGASL